MPSLPSQYKPTPPRPSTRATAAKRGYGRAWQAARVSFLARHLLCAECRKQGRDTAATVVDHVVPHKGDRGLFWDKANWQPLCESCHNTKTARFDR